MGVRVSYPLPLPRAIRMLVIDEVRRAEARQNDGPSGGCGALYLSAQRPVWVEAGGAL
jgi:hypothetical protein